MAENFHNLLKKKDTQVQEAQRVTNKMNTKKPIPRHIIVKMAKVKDKERILRAARKRQLVTYKGAPKGCQLISWQKHFRPEGIGMKY